MQNHPQIQGDGEEERAKVVQHVRKIIFCVDSHLK